LLEIGRHVVLTDCGTLSVEASLDRVAIWGRRRQCVSGSLEAVSYAERRRPIQFHGRTKRYREVSGDHGLELAETAALSKRELVLG